MENPVSGMVVGGQWCVLLSHKHRREGKITSGRLSIGGIGAQECQEGGPSEGVHCSFLNVGVALLFSFPGDCGLRTGVSGP